MLRNFFSKITGRQAKVDEIVEKPVVPAEPAGSAFENKSFRIDEYYSQTNKGSLSDRLSSKNYRKAFNGYLTNNAAKADNFKQFHEMLHPVTGVFLSSGMQVQADEHEEVHEATCSTTSLELSPEQVMLEILDKMRDGAVERNSSDEEHLSSSRADTYRRRWVLRIAGESETPTSVLRRLVDEGDASVRMQLAENANAPVDVLWKLAKDANPDIRYALSENHNVALEILNILVDDENPYVASRAHKTLKRISARTLYDSIRFGSQSKKQSAVSE